MTMCTTIVCSYLTPCSPPTTHTLCTNLFWSTMFVLHDKCMFKAAYTTSQSFYVACVNNQTQKIDALDIHTYAYIVATCICTLYIATHIMFSHLVHMVIIAPVIQTPGLENMQSLCTALSCLKGIYSIDVEMTAHWIFYQL